MLKEILIRLFIYPFCALLFWGAWQMTFEPTYYDVEFYNLRTRVYGTFGLLASVAYPITDILIGLKKIIKNKNDNSK